MKSHLFLYAGLIATSVAACSSDVDPRRGTRDPEATGGSAGTGSMTDPGTSEPDDVRARCEQSNVAPAMLRRLTRHELQSTILSIFPEIAGQWSGVRLGPDPLSPLELTNDASQLLVGPQTAKEIFQTAEDVAVALTTPETLGQILPCSQTAADRVCAETFIDTFGLRVLRRPIADEERSEFLAYFDSVVARSDFPIALKWTIITMLQSPMFVYRSELGNASGQLSQYEIATALSYTFGGTTPSQDLLAKAEAGHFSSPEVLVGEAQALLDTEDGRETLRRFFREWAGYEHVLGTTKVGVTNFESVQLAMVEETRRFIDDVLTSGGGVQDLLMANYTFVDPTLAQFYGFGAAASGFERTERPAEWGLGLLAQGSFLAGNAHPELSSPVFRGLMVFTKLLCNPEPPVPDVVPKIEESPPANTTRERYEIAHAADGCVQCHRIFEPFGFAMEHFDAAGRYRTDENGFAIDATAEILLPDGEPLNVDGLTELATSLADQPVVTDCVSGMMAAYAFAGGGGTPCLAEEARARLASGSTGLLGYYAELAAAPSFTRRAR